MKPTNNKKIPSPFIASLDIKKISRDSDSLRDRLQAMSNELDRQKAEEAARRENERLQPFRETIKKLTQTKQDLQGILYAMVPHQGRSMQEILDDVREQRKNQEQLINELIEENKEALGLVGITTLEQLVTNNDFAETPEVSVYHTILKKLSDISKKDEYLAERLAEFSIVLAHFSYGEATEKVKEKINMIDLELIEEKQKTPEGIEEISDAIQTIFSMQIPTITLVENTDLTRDMYPQKLIFSSTEGETKLLFALEKTSIAISLGHNDISSIISLVPADYNKIADRFSLETAYNAFTRVLKKQASNIAEQVGGNLHKDFITKKIYEILERIISFQQDQDILIKKSRDYDMNADIFYYDSLKEKIENKKSEVTSLKRYLESLEQGTDPTTILFLEGDSLLFPHQKQDYESARSHRESKERDLRALENKITYQKNNPPWMNKERWQFEIDQLALQMQGIEQEITELEKKERQVYNGNRIYFPLDKSPFLREFLLNQEKQEGTLIDIKYVLQQYFEDYVISESIPKDLEIVAQIYEQSKQDIISILK